MKEMFSRRFVIRLTSFSLAAVTALGIACVGGYSRARKSSRLACEIYQRASMQLCEYTGTLSETLLETCAVTDSARLCSLAAASSAACGAAKSQLSVLGGESAVIYGFFTAAQNFAEDTGSNGVSLTADKRRLALDLSDKADTLHTALSGAAKQVLGSEMSAPEITDAVLGAADSLDLNVDAVNAGVTASRVSMTSGLPAVTRQDAAKAASDFCGVPAVLWRDGGNGGGEIPLYIFTCEDISISVTKNGGLIFSFVNSADCGEIQLPVSRAHGIALEALAKAGYSDMVCLKSCLVGSRADLEFVKEQKGVLCCDETVKIGVCLASGNILRFDASGYLTCHRERGFDSLPKDLSFAGELAPEGFTLMRTDLAVVDDSVCIRAECLLDSRVAVLYYEINSLAEKKIEFLPCESVYNRSDGQ